MMVIVKRCLAASAALLGVWLVLSPGVALAQAAAGATPAELSVDASGNATASIELTVPPGPHGVQPELALAYSSAAKNGIMGVGWALQGLSAITRGGPAKYYDSDELAPYFGQVTYTQRSDSSITDRFFLDGQRLIAVKNSDHQTLTSVTAQNAAYGRSGTTYHTALESWVKVTSHATAGVGPQYFVVLQKDGTTLEYGKTEDSRIQVPGGTTVRIWALNQVRDPNGNSMTFSYTEDSANGDYRLASISYTANPSMSPAFAARNSVSFVYEDRNDRPTTYQAGYLSRLAKRLKEIQTSVGTTRVKTYKLTYGYGSATRRSRLASVQECDGAGACMPATTFAYSDFTPDGTFTIKTPNQSVGMLADFVNVFPGDYNGDGKTDLLRQEESSWDDDTLNSFNVLFSNGSGDFQIVTPTGNTYQYDLRFDPGVNILPGDFNGDGKTDFLRQEKGGNDNDDTNTFNVYFSKGDGYSNIVTPQGGMYQYDLKSDTGCNIQPADVNGDGVTDFLRQEKNDWAHNNAANTFNVYFSRRDGYFDKAVPAGNEYQEELKYTGGAIMIPGDYNGDGAVDFLRQEWQDWDHDTSNSFNVYFSKRDGTSTRVTPSGSEYQDRLRYDPGANIIPGDFNGDGLQDFLRQEWGGWDDEATATFQVYFSRGKGAFDIVEPAGSQFQDWLRYDAGAYIIPGDFNGDGLQDFIRQERGDRSKDNNDTFNIYLSRGDGNFDKYTPGGSDYQTRLKADHGGVAITVGDYNGDGIDDFMAMRKSSAEGSTNYWVYLSKGPFPDLLTSMTDGLKKTTWVAYKSLTDPSVYTKGTGAAYPVVDEQPAAPVVYSFTLTDANGNSSRQDYTYEALKTRRDGSGLSSFAKIHKLAYSNGVKQTTEYHQDTFLSGQIKSISKTQGTTVLEATEYTYYAGSSAGAHPYVNVSQPLLQRADVKHYVTGALKYTTRQEYTYDGYGNITKLVDYGDVNVASERLYTTSQYSNNETTWILGLVTATKQAKADGSTLASWDAAKDLTWEKIGYDAKGNVIRQERYNDQGNNWLANVTTRNGFGDPISTVDPTGNTATLVYDASATYVQERRVANGTLPALVTRFVYDPRFGEMTSQTDPNARNLTYTLDGFGRFIAVQGPRPDDPNQRVELVRREWANTAQGMVRTLSSRTDWSANYGSTTSPWYWEKEYTDGFGRAYKKDTLGPDGRIVTEDTSYTPQGWVAKRTFPHWSTETGSSLPGLTIAYDTRGLPTTINSGGVVTSIAVKADGKSFTRTEAAGTPSARNTSYALDSRLKVISKTDAGNGVTKIQYDPLSRPIKVTDPDGVVHTTVYTSLGLKKEVSDPDTGVTRFQYSNGLLSSETNARGNTINYTYDPSSRVRQKTVTWSKAGASQSTVVDYQYDTASGSAAYTNLAGNVYSVITRTQGVIQSEYRFGYDAYGHASLMEVRLVGQSAPFVFRYGYDPLARQVEQVFPDNSRARTSYQPSGNMAVVALEDAVRGTRGPLTSYTTYKGYSARGEPTGVEYGNGVQAALTYNPTLGMLTRNTMTYGPPSSASSPKLVDDQYDWDPLGEVTQIKDLRTSPGGAYDPHPFHNTTRAFTYTAAGRIATANGPTTYGSLAYTYSPGGDLLTKEGVTYTKGTGHRVASGQKAGTPVFSATYDPTGNRVTKTGENASQWGYTYDGENRLVEVTKNTAMAGTFDYDHAGRRTRKIDVATGTTTWYVWQDYEVTTFGASAGGQTQHTKYLTGQTGPSASITHPAAEVTLAVAAAAGRSLTPGDNGAGHPVVGTFFLHKDHIGSTQIVTDHLGKVVSRVVYKPFGDIDPGSSEGSDIHRAKFGGQELDGESGLYYFNARYYDATIGRFISPDSVMGSGFLQVDAFNRYAFAGNNPIRNIDPSGHSFLVGLIVGAVVGATVAFATELIQQGVNQGWGNIQIGKVFAAGLRGAVSGLLSAAVGGAASKVADKAVKKLTDGVKKGVKRAINIGVHAVAGAAADAAVQATSNGIQAARGQEVDWARTMLISISVGAVAGGAGGALDGWHRGSYDVTPLDGKGARQPKASVLQGLHLRDHLKDMEVTDWGIMIGGGASATIAGSTLNAYFDDASNNSDTTGDAFSTSGFDNAPAPQYNGRMIINVVAGQACLRHALDDLEASRPSN
ncbi:MAG: VCBS repeat-containing protein [Myxococcales bacterium]|nr:VCBS repeat-containing protein [Myxococcales bacterium]